MPRAAGVVIAFVAALAVVGPGALPTARADTCADEATLLRRHLEVEEHRARRWNTAWAIAYASVAALQFAVVLAEYKPFGAFDDKFRDSMLVGGSKASIGVAARVVLPLRVRSSAPASGDACADVAVLRALLDDGGRRERRSFFLNHLGGLAVNGAGAAILWHRHDLATASVSFGTGIVAGILAAYTQPRRSWHLWRERRTSWSAGVSPLGHDGWGVGLSGTW